MSERHHQAMVTTNALLSSEIVLKSVDYKSVDLKGVRLNGVDWKGVHLKSGQLLLHTHDHCSIHCSIQTFLYERSDSELRASLGGRTKLADLLRRVYLYTHHVRDALQT